MALSLITMSFDWQFSSIFNYGTYSEKGEKNLSPRSNNKCKSFFILFYRFLFQYFHISLHQTLMQRLPLLFFIFVYFFSLSLSDFISSSQIQVF